MMSIFTILDVKFYHFKSMKYIHTYYWVVVSSVDSPLMIRIQTARIENNSDTRRIKKLTIFNGSKDWNH